MTVHFCNSLYGILTWNHQINVLLNLEPNYASDDVEKKRIEHRLKRGEGLFFWPHWKADL